MREIALFSGKIYTADTNFTRPPVATVATNLNSVHNSNLSSSKVNLGVHELSESLEEVALPSRLQHVLLDEVTEWIPGCEGHDDNVAKKDERTLLVSRTDII